MEVDETKEEGKEDDQEAAHLKSQEQDYAFAKYNVQARLPRPYTDDEYNRHLKRDDWSREETDYLMELASEYDLRWVIIADRYDYQPPMDTEPDASALVPATQYRNMEQMKARYYQVAAHMLALEHPPSEMSELEFELHEKMLKFDPERERDRKQLAALQLDRTADEVREEAMLLEELKRITSNEQNFVTERRELYSRLEVPISIGNTAMYQSSAGLSQLLQTLLQADKSKKRRSLLGADGVLPSPAGQTPTQGGGETPGVTPASIPTRRAPPQPPAKHSNLPCALSPRPKKPDTACSTTSVCKPACNSAATAPRSSRRPSPTCKRKSWPPRWRSWRCPCG